MNRFKRKYAPVLLILLTALVLTGCAGGKPSDKNGGGRLSENDIRFAADFGTFSEDGVVRIETADGKYGFINYKGETVAMPRWDYAEDMSGGAAVVRVNGETSLLGGVNSAGKQIVPTEYTKLEWFPMDQVFVGAKKVNNAERYYLIGKTGSILSDGQWDEIGRFNNGRAAVKKGGSWGVIDSAGNVIVQPKYDKLYVSGDAFWTYINGELCRISADGKILNNASRTLSQVNHLAKGSRVTVNISGKPYVDIISEDTVAVEVRVKANYDATNFTTYAIFSGMNVSVPLLDEGYATQWISAYSKDSIILTSHPLKASAKYKNVFEADTSRYVYSVVKANGSVIVKPGQYKAIDHLHESGIYNISGYSGKGLMKPGGEVVVNPIYTSIEPMHRNKAAFKTGTLWGYLDRNGQIIIPAQYEKARSFGGSSAIGEYAAVKSNGAWHIINSSGSIVY